MPAEKHNLPQPTTATDFYLAAVLAELRELNAIMAKLTAKANTAAKPKEATPNAGNVRSK